MRLHVFVFCLLAVTGAQQSDDSQGQTTSGSDTSDELTEDQSAILNSLGFENLLELVDAENGALDILQIEEMLHLISAGNNMDKPVEEALEGTLADFLLLSADVLADEFGNGSRLTRRQFSEALPAIVSCLANRECALSTDAEFLEHDEEHDHEDEDEHDHEDDADNHEDEDEHDHEDDTDNHEDEDEHDHEDEEDANAHEHEDEHGEHEEGRDIDGHEDEEGEHDEHSHEDEHEQHEHEDEHDEHDHHEDEDDEDEDYVFKIKMAALSILFVEAVFGAMIPITLGTFKGFEHVLSVLNCFAGGVLLSTGLIHLIPHVMEYEDEVDELGDYPLGLVIVVASFAIVFYIEHVLVDVHSHHEDSLHSSSHDIVANASHSEKDVSLGNGEGHDHHSHSHRTLWMQMGDLKHCLVLLAATSVHSILEALVLGIEDDDYSVWLLFASIAGHKGVTAMALSARFSKCKATAKQALFVSILFALTAPISILIGISLDDVPAWTNLILTALSTGTFIYIGAYEVISEEFSYQADPVKKPGENGGSWSAKAMRHLKYVAVVAGIVMISLVALIPHADHGHEHNH